MVKRTELSAEDLAKFKALLIELRARLTGDLSMMEREALSGSDGSSSAPTHMADLGTDAYEQEFTLNLLANEEGRLEKVQAALERIASGEYGTCLECEGRIPKARLEIIPEAPYCVKCASKIGSNPYRDE
ncbi:MAG: TraR/DksA C4-type zinc finger protein [Pirellulales bacterium]